jgi:hypothetical protein
VATSADQEVVAASAGQFVAAIVTADRRIDLDALGKGDVVIAVAYVSDDADHISWSKVERREPNHHIQKGPQAPIGGPFSSAR